ncbi:nucleolar and coiled-body phosphoprotein 1-like [Sarcoptes scabiei]|nr:nucleolar and coiled-body phosphoprotein 1-like [Sarcoptes scabiei]
MFQKYHFVSELESENENNDEDDDIDGMGDRSYDYDDYDDNYDDSKQRKNQKQSLQSTLISSIFNDFDGHQIRNIFVVILYGIIMVISLCGNSIVCYVIYMTPKLQTTTNILIFSLTISDILTTIFNIPFNCARFLLQNYPFPNLFCILMPTIQITSVYVSTLTMAAIGLHRYRSIRDCSKLNIWIPIRNFNRIACSMTSYRIKLWIVFIWFISILLALPHSLFNKVVIVAIKQNNPTIVHRCRAVYPVSIEQQMPLMLSLLTTLTQFLLPLGFTSVLYARIGRIIAHQGRITRHYCDHTNRRIIEAKRKRIKMLILIVFCFLITWLPLTVYHLLIDFHLVHFYWNLFLMLHIWAMTSLCYNPFIYCLMNDDFLRLSTDSVPKILKWILICASTSTTTSMVRVDCNRMIKSNPTMTTTTVSDRINDE